MPRYVVMMPVAPRADVLDESTPLLPSLTVYDGDPGPVPAGLVDLRGHSLGRIVERERMGFRSPRT